ncbi:hypothetical protein [Sinosporangium album]|nr:hypothetical protein [Sinosporangium album]
MGYELRVERQAPLPYAELASTVSPVGFELRGTQQVGEVVARHREAAHTIGTWDGRLVGRPESDWQVAQLALLADALGARLVGEDGEVYAIRDGILETVNGGTVHEFGKLDEILDIGPAAWRH